MSALLFVFSTGRLWNNSWQIVWSCSEHKQGQTNQELFTWDLVNFIYVKFFVSRVGEEGLLRLWQDSLKFLTRPSQNPLNQVLVNFDWMTSRSLETQDLTPDSKLSPRKKMAYQLSVVRASRCVWLFLVFVLKLILKPKRKLALEGAFAWERVE